MGVVVVVVVVDSVGVVVVVVVVFVVAVVVGVVAVVVVGVVGVAWVWMWVLLCCCGCGYGCGVGVVVIVVAAVVVMHATRVEQLPLHRSPTKLPHSFNLAAYVASGGWCCHRHCYSPFFPLVLISNKVRQRLRTATVSQSSTKKTVAGQKHERHQAGEKAFRL